MKNLPALPLFLTVLLMAMSQPCYAHKVRIFAWEEGADIVTESKFSGGRPARKATVSVIDTTTGQQLLTGTTDEAGLFRFPIPAKGGQDLDIVVDGGDGHKNSWKYSLKTSPNQLVTTQPQPPPEHPKQSPAAADPARSSTPAATSQPGIDAGQLSAIIDETLERKLAPIRRSLAENSERGPSLQDILGGIGYIFGLAGIAAYMKYQRKSKE